MDVALDNSDFTGLYLETDLDWTMLKAETLKPADFTDNVAHLTYHTQEKLRLFPRYRLRQVETEQTTEETLKYLTLK